MKSSRHICYQNLKRMTVLSFVFPGKPYLSIEEPDIRMAAGEDPRGFLAVSINLIFSIF